MSAAWQDRRMNLGHNGLPEIAYRCCCGARRTTARPADQCRPSKSRYSSVPCVREFGAAIAHSLAQSRLANRRRKSNEAVQSVADPLFTTSYEIAIRLAA